MSNSKLIEVLDYLGQKELDDEKQYEETLARFREVDFDDSRYSTIFEFLVNSQAERRGIEILNENLKNFIREKEKELSKNEVLKKNIDKTYDYLQLEYQRYKELSNLRDDLKSIQEKTKKEEDNVIDIRKEINSIDTEARQIQEQMANIQNKIKTIKSEAKQIQTQYITILGIFASIIMTFVGGLTFSTSVLSHMHEVSIYRLVFVICCIGALVFNVLFALFGFILKIVDKKVNYLALFVANIGFVIALAINLYFFDHWGNDKRESPKQEVNLSIQAKTK